MINRLQLDLQTWSRVATLASLLVPIAAAAACSGAATEPAPGPAVPENAALVQISEADAGAAGIETVAAVRVERAEQLQASGVVGFDERRTARLGSLVEGVVDELPVQVGDRVARGAVVARLHSHVVHDAWAGYFKALAGQKRADAELEYARTAESRSARLLADKALSPQEVERARADVASAAQMVAAAGAETLRAEQELAHYGIRAQPSADPSGDQDIAVRSPLDGTVTERLATGGTAVTPGTPLLVVSDLSRVWVIAEIDEPLLGRLTSGGPVAISAAAYPGETFNGTLAAIGDTINPETRRVTLRIEAPNRDRRLKPQMFVTVTLATAVPRAALVIPSHAIQTMEGEQVVFVRTAAARFERRSVRLGADADGLVEITSGLREGEAVATSGAFLLKSELLKTSGGEEP